MKDHYCAHIYTYIQTKISQCCSHGNWDSVIGHDWGLLAIRRYFKGELIPRVRNFRNYF